MERIRRLVRAGGTGALWAVGLLTALWAAGCSEVGNRVEDGHSQGEPALAQFQEPLFAPGVINTGQECRGLGKPGSRLILGRL
jgi:hypothetical protein